MVLIVNTTSDTSISEEVKNYAVNKGIGFEILEAGSMKISPCLGCNFCWLKTPGECAIKDDYEVILKKIIKADQLWVITGTALGFMDHKGKNIFDRILPVCTMFLYFKDKEMRHVLRYDKNPDLGIIISGDADTEYLERWSERAAINIGSRSLGVFGRDEIKEASKCMC